MRMILVSEDAGLFAFVRELLAQLSIEGHFSMVAPDDAGEHAELYIWDFHPDLRMPADVGALARKHLFLVSRDDLAGFSQRSPADASIVLKPPTAGAIEAFLSGLRDRASSHVAASRSQSDDILQGLIQANLKLQEYDHQRTNFLARAVHDFRAPLTAISGYCGLLLTGQLGSLAENQKDVLARMEHSSRKLSRMASAMFQLSVGRHIDQKPNLERGDIRECIEQALHEIAPFSQEKRIDIGVEVDDPSDFLRFERSQIEQVLMNLLDNACKFTPRMGTITIRGFPFFWERRAASLIEYVAERRAQELRTPNSFRIDICDSGPGIPPAHLSRIFEEYTFYAGPHDRSGGGLGLAICKMILHNHHGRVWAQSSSAGAIFSFVLPFHRPETPHESAVRAFDNFQYVHHR